MIYLQLLWVYLKIGMFGFGGGYAMLSLIQHEIVDIHHWLTPQQFTDVVAISQMTPGPIVYLLLFWCCSFLISLRSVRITSILRRLCPDCYLCRLL